MIKLIRIYNKAGWFMLISLLTVGVIFTTPSFSATVSDAIKHAEEVQHSKVKRLESAITSQQSKIEKSKTKEASLYKELKSIDKDLFGQQKAIQLSQERLLKQEGFLQEKEYELTLIREDKEKAEVHIKNRLNAFYQMGDIGVINTLFSASTLPDLLNIKEYFHYLFQYDRLAIKRYKDKIALLAGARENIISGKEQLLKIIVDTRSQEKALIASRQNRSQLLNNVRTEEHLYKQALTEIENSATNLAIKFNQYKTTLILNAKKIKLKAGNKKRVPDLSKYFTGNKGKLPPPVYGGIITTYFGKSKGVFGVEVQSSGIDIQIKNRSKVQAIFKGKIVYAGDLTGYGNVVIIDHGEQYFSLVSRMNTVLFKKGAWVEQGQVIGSINKEHGGLLKNGLHLEIRKGSTPEDPLKWIDKSRITFELTQNM